MWLKCQMKTVSDHIGSRLFLRVRDRLRRRVVGATSPLLPKSGHSWIDRNRVIVSRHLEVATNARIASNDCDLAHRNDVMCQAFDGGGKGRWLSATNFSQNPFSLGAELRRQWNDWPAQSPVIPVLDQIPPGCLIHVER